MVDKPDAATICPATGKKLRLKDLTPVQVLIICIENPSDVEQEAIALRQADEVTKTNFESNMSCRSVSVYHYGFRGSGTDNTCVYFASGQVHASARGRD